MKPIVTLLIISGIILQLLLSPVFAGSNDVINENLMKTNEYITLLKEGANPDNVTRPRLRRYHKYRVKRAAREMYQSMDKAEALAREGKRNLIQKYNYIDTGE
jgi:hypothetical protein